MIENKENMTKVNKIKGCIIYENLSTLEVVDDVQRLHLPGRLVVTGVMCRTADYNV